MSNLHINTTQNIQLFFTPASVGERMLAFLADLLIRIAYMILIFFLFDNILAEAYNYKTAIYILLILPFVFYSLVCETLLDGRTFGKMLLKIKVVKIDGYQSGFLDYFIRWIFSIVDIYLTPIPGILSMVFNKHTRRLGDLAAGTAVISEKSKYNLSHTILMDIQDNYQPCFARNQIMLFSDNDIRIVKENMELAEKNKNTILLQKIADKILSIMNATNPFVTNSQMITTFLKDYNYYTGNHSQL
ncbi:MAG: domain containing protein [Bacteroidetes bacterium]|jgi:uncharacterized RDD family membrane protein YckC|nr:domain containing protein [Bacteroidota bacterium]